MSTKKHRPLPVEVSISVDIYPGMAVVPIKSQLKVTDTVRLIDDHDGGAPRLSGFREVKEFMLARLGYQLDELAEQLQEQLEAELAPQAMSGPSSVTQIDPS